MIFSGKVLLLNGPVLSLIAAAILSLAAPAEAIMLYRTGDPTANTTEPTGSLAGSGWQYEGRFGNFLGTPIAPRFFITARHIGGAPNFVFRGVTYTILRSIHDSGSDLAIHEVAQPFPAYAQLYSRSDEVGRRFVVFGRGTQRGPQRIVSGQLRGWNWGASDMIQRWGENTVASITSGGRVLYSLFDQAGLPHEAHLSGGDSGGGLFISDAGVWKLAGINLDVDRFSSGPDGGGPYNAAMFDQRGSYRPNGSLVTGSAPVPSGFYATRISSRLAWIASVIGQAVPPPPSTGSHVPGDFNADSKPDLIWQNKTTGERGIWLMNGVTYVEGRPLPTISPLWQIVGNGDFNHDGHPDIVWENDATGERSIWFMEAATRLGEGLLPRIATEWKIAGTGEFNRDGQVDIIWQNSVTGQRTVWFMNGTTMIGEGILPSVSLQWQIAGSDDFSGDGQVDLIWQNSATGQRAVWLMNGITRVGERSLPTVSTQWEIAGTGEFNGDGQADLLWQNNVTGQRAIWLMSGTDLVGDVALPPISPEWEIRNL